MNVISQLKYKIKSYFKSVKLLVASSFLQEFIFVRTILFSIKNFLVN
jgi:hypothetical protein